METLRGELGRTGLAAVLAAIPEDSGPAGCGERGGCNCAPEAAQFVLFRDDSNEVENGDFF